MARRRFTLVGSAALLLTLSLCSSPLAASDTKTQKNPSAPSPSIVDPNAPKISSQTRLAIVRSLQAERVFAKLPSSRRAKKD